MVSIGVMDGGDDWTRWVMPDLTKAGPGEAGVKGMRRKHGTGEALKVLQGTK